MFSCNGSLTKWIYGGIPHSGNNRNDLPELQIWRQLGPNNYNKTGSSLVNASTMIGTNLYEFIPQTPLQFQEGDVLGVHIPRSPQSLFYLYEQIGNGPLNEQVDADNPLSTITQALVTDTNNDFPLVTVEVSSKLLMIILYDYKFIVLVESTSTVIATPSSSMNAVIPPSTSSIISISDDFNSSLLSLTYSSSSFDTPPFSSTMITTTAPSDSPVIAATVAISSSTANSSSIMMTGVSPGSSSSTTPPNSVSATSTISVSVISTVNSVSSQATPSTAILSSMEPSSLSSVVSTSTSSTTTNTTPVAVYIIVGIVVCSILASLVIIALSVAVCIKKKGRIIIDTSDMKDNPAYIATNPVAVTIKDNPAYAANVGNECNEVDYEELDQVITQDYDEIDDCL